MISNIVQNKLNTDSRANWTVIIVAAQFAGFSVGDSSGARWASSCSRIRMRPCRPSIFPAASSDARCQRPDSSAAASDLGSEAQWNGYAELSITVLMERTLLCEVG